MEGSSGALLAFDGAHRWYWLSGTGYKHLLAGIAFRAEYSGRKAYLFGLYITKERMYFWKARSARTRL
jgi:hypothetical protein